MPKRYYAVKVGAKPGIYRDWDECREQVNGFSGARYKGFNVLYDAEAWLGPVKKKPAKAKRKRVRKDRYNWAALCRKPKVTNPRGKTQFYNGDTPPWEFPGPLITCIEKSLDLPNFRWKA